MRRLRTGRASRAADPVAATAGQSRARAERSCVQDLGVPDMGIPELTDGSFEARYRELVLGSLLRVAELQERRHRVLGHRVRARRAERVVRSVRALDTAAATPGRRRALVTLLRAAWAAAIAVLVCGVALFGIGGWRTGAADVVVLVLTVVLFVVEIAGLTEPREP
jgi:hypothetical protein